MVESRAKAKKIYEEYRKKHKLPSLKELEEEFDFELSETSGVISQIYSKIWEKIMKVKSDLEGLFNPQQYCCLAEHKFFTEKELKEFFNMYAEIMKNYWTAVRAGYISKEERIRKIKDSYEFYKKVKEFARKLYARYVKKWGEKGEKESKEAYIS